MIKNLLSSKHESRAELVLSQTFTKFKLSKAENSEPREKLIA
jgi:hypothetical protein